MDQTPPKVFISYKWEDDAHNEWVKKFATDLRAAGVDAILDRWEVRLGEPFTDYMTSKITEADAVLFVMITKSVATAEAPKRGVGHRFVLSLEVGPTPSPLMRPYNNNKETALSNGRARTS